MIRLSQLVHFVTWLAQEYDVKLTTNRLVKYLYLIDVYYARETSGKQTLTGCPWAFINYGPYCREIMTGIDQAVQEGLICEQILTSKYDIKKEYSIYTCQAKGSEITEEKLPYLVTMQLRDALKKLGEDTPLLLDYVYFETEPMPDNIRKFDLLDFSKCSKHSGRSARNTPKKISKSKRLKIKKLLSYIEKDFIAGQKNLIQDNKITEQFKNDAYYNMLKAMEEEDLATGLKGKAKIVI